MKIKFKAYPWITIDRDWPKSWAFHFIPQIELNHWKYEKGGWWTCLLIAWLIFGITFDLRKE